MFKAWIILSDDLDTYRELGNYREEGVIISEQIENFRKNTQGAGQE